MKKYIKKINFKNNKGVTIVALVTAISILVILTAVSIRIGIGNEGIINEAEESTEDIEKQNIIKLIEEAKVNVGVKYNDEVTLENIANEIKEEKIATNVTLHDGYIIVIDDQKNGYVVTKQSSNYEKGIRADNELVTGYTIPQMTSNKTDIAGDGTYYCLASSVLANDTKAYEIFDKKKSDEEVSIWHSERFDTAGWVQVKFPYLTQITNFEMENRYRIDGSVYSIHNFKLQASNDGIEWKDLGTFENTNNESLGKTSYTVPYAYGENAYLYYRIQLIDCYGNYGTIGELSLHGNRYF